ncbi:L-threonylcarbamoyladenylate synthase, partial [Halolamina salina]
MRDDLVQATSMLAMGELAVYPTDTVYGLGADAIAADAVERVYDLKGRSRDDPLSMAVPDVEEALEHVTATEREEAFMREFLPGPVTVVLERQDHVPDALTAGRDRVGIRIPDHDLALDLLSEFAPITATSANRS